MTIQNCTDVAECILMCSFEGTYFEIAGRFYNSFRMSSGGLRTLGIAIPIIASIGAYIAIYAKFGPLCSDLRYENIDDTQERIENARRWSIIFLDFSTMVVGFQLAFMIPASRFLDPLPVWDIFQDRVRTLQYQVCQNSSSNQVQIFKSKFEASSIGPDVIDGSNASLFRVTNVLGVTNIVMMILIGAQFFVTLYKHPSKIMMREIMMAAFILGTLALGIFEVAKGRSMDVAPDLKKSWDDCFQEYNITKKMN